MTADIEVCAESLWSRTTGLQHCMCTGQTKCCKNECRIHFWRRAAEIGCCFHSQLLQDYKVLEKTKGDKESLSWPAQHQGPGLPLPLNTASEEKQGSRCCCQGNTVKKKNIQQTSKGVSCKAFVCEGFESKATREALGTLQQLTQQSLQTKCSK